MMVLGFLFVLLIGFSLGIFVFYRWPNRFTKFIQSLIELFKKENPSDLGKDENSFDSEKK